MRVRGSHHIYARSGSVVRISVPVHGDASLKHGLQRHLMKLGGIDDSDLQAVRAGRSLLPVTVA